MWSFPKRISNSCLPTMFFFGQFVSSSLSKDRIKCLNNRSYAAMHTYFVISLASTIRLSSLTTRGPTHTALFKLHQSLNKGRQVDVTLTFFPDKTIIPVIGVVGITEPSMGVLEFKELVSMFAGMARASDVLCAKIRGKESLDVLESEAWIPLLVWDGTMELRRTSGKMGRCRETSLKVVAQAKRFFNKAVDTRIRPIFPHSRDQKRRNSGSPFARRDMAPADLDALYAQLRRRMVESGEWDRWVWMFVRIYARSDQLPFQVHVCTVIQTQRRWMARRTKRLQQGESAEYRESCVSASVGRCLGVCSEWELCFGGSLCMRGSRWSDAVPAQIEKEIKILIRQFLEQQFEWARLKLPKFDLYTTVHIYLRWRLRAPCNFCKSVFLMFDVLLTFLLADVCHA